MTVWAILAILVLGISAVLLFRPAALLGVDKKSLAQSVGARYCSPVDSSDSWSCAMTVLWGDSTMRVQRITVTADRWGCWSAPPAGPQPDRLSRLPGQGCIGLLDHLVE